jgi:hypothetical protein
LRFLKNGDGAGASSKHRVYGLFWYLFEETVCVNLRSASADMGGQSGYLSQCQARKKYD